MFRHSGGERDCTLFVAALQEAGDCSFVKRNYVVCGGLQYYLRERKREVIMNFLIFFVVGDHEFCLQ